MAESTPSSGDFTRRRAPGRARAQAAASFHMGAGVRRGLKYALIVLLTLLPALLITNAGGLRSSLAFSHRSHAASTATPLPAEPDLPVLVGAQRLSPQGCANGSTPTVTQSFPIWTARDHPGVRDEVALTFDDGPSPLYTPGILAALKTAGAHATFFVIGRHAQRYPNLVAAEWRGGNAVGNHTYDHDYLAGAPPDQVRTNLTATTAAIRTATSDPCMWLFRPPFGDLPWQTQAVTEIRQEGFAIVNWDSLAQDWLHPGADVIAQRIIAQLHPGAIILLHDSGPDTQDQNRSQTVAALPAILAAMRARGLHAVTLPRLLLDAGVAHLPPPPAPAQPSKPPHRPPGHQPSWSGAFAGAVTVALSAVATGRRWRCGADCTVSRRALRSRRHR